MALGITFLKMTKRYHANYGLIVLVGIGFTVFALLLLTQDPVPKDTSLALLVIAISYGIVGILGTWFTYVEITADRKLCSTTMYFKRVEVIIDHINAINECYTYNI